MGKETKVAIGKVLATEKYPTTIDEFKFWTNSDLRLHAFDVVKVERRDGSHTFGVIENILHITDAQSFLTNFISSDFGDTELLEPTLRVGMNYVEAKVSFNTKGNETPVHNNDKVYLATEEEIIQALGLDKIEHKLLCGSLKMYAGTENPVILPVHLNSEFLLGPEGAHLNISGISGLATKTSYAMFLLKAIQDYNQQNEDARKTAFVIFNVKGRDLLAIDKENESDASVKVKEEYKRLGLIDKPFENVKYFIPYSASSDSRQSTYMGKDDVDNYIRAQQLKKYKYLYKDDKESIEMMFANIDDTTQTMESIIEKIIGDGEFNGLDTWQDFLDKVSEKTQKGDPKSQKDEISIMSWRKFKRIVSKAIKNDSMFANGFSKQNNECRLQDELKQIKANDVFVVDIAKLAEDKQAFVFGDCLRTIYDLKQDVFSEEHGVNPPERIVVFIDELNKYAGTDAPKHSPILRGILDVAERGRSLGVVLFGAEQFRSDIHKRVTGNCATHAYGRTNSIETSTSSYSSIHSTYKNMLTRLDQGEYILQNPVFRSLLKVRFPKPIYKQFK
ncbi:MAG: ATP-binding protein [Christensenellaceae bacterium]|jgi:DNA helicase HerA-like ATPase|nr:ATP-binding protein [Christensenellaceae bacterium]